MSQLEQKPYPVLISHLGRNDVPLGCVRYNTETPHLWMSLLLTGVSSQRLLETSGVVPAVGRLAFWPRPFSPIRSASQDRPIPWLRTRSGVTRVLPFTRALAARSSARGIFQRSRQFQRSRHFPALAAFSSAARSIARSTFDCLRHVPAPARHVPALAAFSSARGSFQHLRHFPALAALSSTCGTFQRSRHFPALAAFSSVRGIFQRSRLFPALAAF